MTNVVKDGALVKVVDWAPGVRIVSGEYGSDGTVQATLTITGWTEEQFVKTGLQVEREPTELELLDHRHAQERREFLAKKRRGR